MTREFCEGCRHWIRDDYLGPDYGASHFFCDECLALLEIGQGLVENPLFAAEWKAMIHEQRETERREQGRYWSNRPSFAAIDMRRAIRKYRALGSRTP